MINKNRVNQILHNARIQTEYRKGTAEETEEEEEEEEEDEEQELQRTKEQVSIRIVQVKGATNAECQITPHPWNSHNSV